MLISGGLQGSIVIVPIWPCWGSEGSDVIVPIYGRVDIGESEGVCWNNSKMTVLS